jgi:hypothetical protein
MRSVRWWTMLLLLAAAPSSAPTAMEPRAQQELSGDEAHGEDARLAVWRAHEILSVLVGGDGPAGRARLELLVAGGRFRG